MYLFICLLICTEYIFDFSIYYCCEMKQVSKFGRTYRDTHQSGQRVEELQINTRDQNGVLKFALFIVSVILRMLVWFIYFSLKLIFVFIRSYPDGGKKNGHFEWRKVVESCSFPASGVA